MTEGTFTAQRPRERAASPWVVWERLPEPVRVPTRSLIALARRMNARDTRLPGGPIPPLPARAERLRTRHGGFWFDAADQKLTPWIRRHATWEADVIRLLRSVVRPGMTVVDVGANVGFHTVLLSRLVGPAGRVHAFEPLPETIGMLRANLWRHGCANTVVHPMAVSDQAGVVELEIDPEGGSGTHIGAGDLRVRCTTLDEALADTRVDVLKVDVEGAEPMVLRGAAALIARSPKLLAVVEFRREGILDGSGPQDMLALYEMLGFSLHLLAADGRAVPSTRAGVLAALRGETMNIVLRK